MPRPARDEALCGVVDEALFRVPMDSAYDTATHFQYAERWIALLSSAEARQSTYEKLAKRWLETDADSARAWLSVSPLPAPEKERLFRPKR